MNRIDVEQLRRAHPLADVVAASGIELFPRGKGFMAHCPFHAEDRTPSLSVEGVPDHFHCFGCGASGDVIDFVARIHGLDFRSAAEHLSTDLVPVAAVGPAPAPSESRTPSRTSKERVFEVNQSAWEYFTQPEKRQVAERYLRETRGLDMDRIPTITPGAPLVGLAPDGRRSLCTHLQRQGADPIEIMDAGLAHDHHGRFTDAFRGRVVVPIRDQRDRIEGFFGRDITGNDSAPKYLNPTTTIAYDKSQSLYWPLGRPAAPCHTVVIVEGFIDALAVATTRDPTGAPWFPCSSGGTSVSPHQVREVTTLSTRPILLALDADAAGREGIQRWRHQLDQLNRSTRIANLPPGLDPAEALTRSMQGLSL